MHTINLLVSYSRGCFPWARNEILYILKQLGDPQASVKPSSVSGIALVCTSLNNRTVIRQCRQLWRNAEFSGFQFAIKWVPVDYWCKTDLTEMKNLIDTKIRHQIKADQTWGMVVKKRRYQKHHAIDIIRYLAQDIHQSVNLSDPDRIVWVDIVGKQTAISLLKGDEIFSACLTQI